MGSRAGKRLQLPSQNTGAPAALCCLRRLWFPDAEQSCHRPERVRPTSHQSPTAHPCNSATPCYKGMTKQLSMTIKILLKQSEWSQKPAESCLQSAKTNRVNQHNAASVFLTSCLNLECHRNRFLKHVRYRSNIV